jgi:hypothetical protein
MLLPMRLIISCLMAVSLLAGTAFAVDTPAPAEAGPEQFLALAEAYQSGFLQLAALATLEIYSSAGIVATDFAAGYIDASTALTALDQISLLHSAGYYSLESVLALTPPADAVATAELTRLMELYVAEDALLSALYDVAGAPDEQRAAAAEAARARVETLLNAYAGEPAVSPAPAAVP